MKLKIGKKLEAASLKSKFTSSYKKNVILQQDKLKVRLLKA